MANLSKKKLAGMMKKSLASLPTGFEEAKKVLGGLPKKKRKAMLRGDWDTGLDEAKKGN